MMQQATIKTTMRRVMVLLAVMMAALVVLSGPVARVLDLPEPTAEAKKKKKKKRPPAVAPAPAPELNLVRCAGGMSDPICEGTAGNDNMIGISTHSKNISALAGNDLISAGAGNDATDGGRATIPTPTRTGEGMTP